MCNAATKRVVIHAGNSSSITGSSPHRTSVSKSPFANALLASAAAAAGVSSTTGSTGAGNISVKAMRAEAIEAKNALSVAIIVSADC